MADRHIDIDIQGGRNQVNEEMDKQTNKKYGFKFLDFQSFSKMSNLANVRVALANRDATLTCLNEEKY